MGHRLEATVQPVQVFSSVKADSVALKPAEVMVAGMGLALAP